MTKILPLTLVCTFMCMSLLNGQSSGKLNISTAIGLTPTYHGKTASTTVPAISFQVGYDISKKFNLSAFAAYTAASSKERIFSDGLASNIENKTTAFGLRGELRKSWTDNLEIYGGFVLGYKAFNIKEFNSRTGEQVIRDPEAPTPYNPNAPKGQLLYSGFVGTKYFIQKKFGFFGELGYGLSIVKAGVTFRL